MDTNGDPITGVTAGPDTTLKSNKTQDVTLTLPNWDVVDMQVVSVNGDTGAYSAVCKQNAAGRWILSDITADTTLKVMIVPSNSRVNVTIVTAAGSPAAVADKTATKIMPVAGGTIDISDFMVTGYGVTAAAAKTANATGTTAFSASLTGSTLTLSGASVDADTTVTLTYAAIAPKVSTSIAGTNPAVNTFEYRVSPDTAWTTLTADLANLGKLKDGSTDIAYGAKFELRWTPNPLYNYTVTVGGDTLTQVADNGKVVVSCDLTAASTTVTVAEAAKSATEVATVAIVGTDANNTVTGLTAGQVEAGKAISFTTTPDTGKEVYSVTWAIPGGASGSATKTAANAYTLPAEALVAGKLTTVTITFVASAGVTLAEVKTGYTGTLTYQLNDGAQVAVLPTPVKSGDVLTIWASAGKPFAITPTAGATQVLDASAIVVAEDGMSATITFPVMTGNTSITIADKT